MYFISVDLPSRDYYDKWQYVSPKVYVTNQAVGNFQKYSHCECLTTILKRQKLLKDEKLKPVETFQKVMTDGKLNSYFF